MFQRNAGKVDYTLRTEPVIENYEFKPKLVLSAVRIDRWATLEMLFERYDLDLHDITEIENLFRQINVVPSVYHHNALYQIRDVDYR
jgi:hypothetical protein